MVRQFDTDAINRKIPISVLKRLSKRELERIKSPLNCD